MFDPDLHLAALKRPPSAPVTGPAPEAFHFQLYYRGAEARLRTVDAQGKPVEVDYRSRSGWERELLKGLAATGEESWERISWDGGETASGEEGMTLSGRPDLALLLRRCDNLVDEGMERLLPGEGGAGTLALLLREEAGDRVKARLELRTGGGEKRILEEPRLVVDGLLQEAGVLYPVNPLGPACTALPYFSEELHLDQLEPFLTLFASTFPELGMEFPGWKVETGEQIPARPALIFREVDAEGTLHFRLAEAVGRLPVEFVRDYDISVLALVDREGRTLRTHAIHYEAAYERRAGLVRELKTLERRSKASESFLVEEDPGDYMLSGNLAREFLSAHLAPLARDFVLFGTERLRSYRIVHSKPVLKVKLGPGIDYLDGEAELAFGEERVSLLDALSQYRKNSYVQLSDGNQAVVDPDYMNRLERLFRKRGRGVRVSFFDLPVIEELIAERAAESTLPESRTVFREFNRLGERRLSLKGFSGKLRPYQKAGVKWLSFLQEHGFGACLADDMGLGKTVQAIALLARICPGATDPVLIVMPRSLLFNWSRELESFLPGVSYHVHYGSGRDWEEAVRSPLILTTYGTLRADIEAIAGTRFEAVILDESQAIKNLQTQTAKAAMALKAGFRLALSGTPVENHLGELYALFRFLNPAMFAGATDFERTYARPIQEDSDPGAAHDLRRKIYPFLLRRLKGEVLKDLPPKVEQVLYVEMGEDQKRHYESRRRFYQKVVRNEIETSGLAQSRFVILEALQELRQIATVPEARTEGRISSAKRERLREAVIEGVENGRKCLVFTNFLAGVEQVCEDLNAAGLDYERMTGATGNREERVRRFQEDPRVAVFVMTLKTGGLGLNLTAADMVFILDPWWNTSAESQAVDRAHRIGQANTVFTYRLIARDTIEEKILKLQERKKALVDQVVSTDAGAFKALSESDIDHLFTA